MIFENTTNGVIFIQSLKQGDAQTGRSVHEHVRPMLLSKGLYSEPSVRTVNTAAELLSTLGLIRQLVKAHHLRPVIQIDAHGDETGIQIADGTVIPWFQLASPLRGINEASKNSTVLCSAMCQGGHLCRIALESGAFLPSPYWATLGPMRTLTAGALQAAFEGFWTHLLMHEDAPAALSIFQATAGETSFVQAEMLFGRIWMRYVIDLQNDPDDLDARIERVFLASGGRVPRDWIRARLSSLPALESGFREAHGGFLWTDKFPETRTRYRMTFADACKMFPNA